MMTIYLNNNLQAVLGLNYPVNIIILDFSVN